MDRDSRGTAASTHSLAMTDEVEESVKIKVNHQPEIGVD
jgi:hypothetical protein